MMLRTTASVWIVLAATFAVARGAVAAQHAPAAQFIERARESTRRYLDREAAAADGYRAVGPDFPAMGEHWVNPGLVIRGVFDPERPQILSYAEIDGSPRLVGIAYAIPLADGESPPAFPHEHAWHVHSGTVEEESLLRVHDGDPGSGGFRLAVLHAWIWLENPEGTFATDNWSLPYARLGLAAPRDAPRDAARALSLASGGDAFYDAVLRALGRPDAASETVMTASIARARERVLERLRTDIARDRRRELGAADAAALAALWETLWDELARTLDASLAERLRPARDR